MVVGSGRGSLRNRWFLAGALIAAACTIPDIWWQAQHGWATLSMTRALNSENGGLGNIGAFVSGQLVMALPVLIPVWWKGLRFLWRAPHATWRALAWCYPALFAFFMLTAGTKPYYLAGTYFYLLPAGIVAYEPLIASGARRVGAFIWASVVGGVAVAGFILPWVPAHDFGPASSVYADGAETVGWPQFVQTVSTAWHDLTPAQRNEGVIFTADYGEAGAINELGRPDGLPTAMSSQNSEWWWGPCKPDATTVLAVAPGPKDVTDYGGYLRQYFRSVRVVATITNSAGLHNQEWGGHLYVCTKPKESFGALWPKLRHYS